MKHCNKKFIFIFLVLNLLSGKGYAATKMALLIGNQNYENSTALKNTINDVEMIGEQLNKLGFFVIQAKNKNKTELREELRLFHSKLRKGDTGLVYYSGHGLQYQGDNYLVPIGADIEVATEIPSETISSSELLDYMKSASVKIVILDACRNNPFKTGSKSIGKGLHRKDLTNQNNTLIAFAAAPNQEASDGSGDNSPYALALRNALQVEGKTLEQIFKSVRKQVSSLTSGKQTPWYNASLIDDIYLNGNRSSRIEDVIEKTPQQEIPVSDVEISFWKEVKKKHKVIYYSGYLEKYGENGRFSEEARKNIKLLEQNVTDNKSESEDSNNNEVNALEFFNAI